MEASEAQAFNYVLVGAAIPLLVLGGIWAISKIFETLDRISRLELSAKQNKLDLNSLRIRLSSLEFDVRTKCHSMITDVKSAEETTCESCPCKTETPKCAAKSAED